jgi:hypothetical protein
VSCTVLDGKIIVVNVSYKLTTSNIVKFCVDYYKES